MPVEPVDLLAAMAAAAAQQEGADQGEEFDGAEFAVAVIAAGAGGDDVIPTGQAGDEDAKETADEGSDEEDEKRMWHAVGVRSISRGRSGPQ